jgi:hypothetical protein
MSTSKLVPSTVVWDWRARAGAAEARRAREAAEIRRRGLLGAVIGLAVAAVVWFLWKRPVPAVVIATVALLLSLPGLAAPLTAGRQVARGLDRLAYGVGLGVTWVLMTLLFYLLFLPVGLLLRARGRLRIARAWEPQRPTYWVSTGERPRTPESYRRQF